MNVGIEGKSTLQHAGEGTVLLTESVPPATVFPTELPSLPGVELAAGFLSIGGRVDTGGDWCDGFTMADGRLLLSMGDVTGHGQEAALVMEQLRTALHSYALEDARPATILARLNNLLYDTYSSDMLATALVGIYDPYSGVLTWANAGHPFPILIEADRSVRTLEQHGLILGVLPGVSYAEQTVLLSLGTTVLWYTDGLIERRALDLDIRDAQPSVPVPRTDADDDGAEDRPAWHIVDHVAHTLLDENPSEDDACLLVLVKTEYPVDSGDDRATSVLY